MINNKNFLSILLTVLLVAFAGYLNAQTSNTDISVFKNGYLTDLDGKVPVGYEGSIVRKNNSHNSPMDFTTYPGFPITTTYDFANSKNGGIYCNMDSDADLEIVYGAGHTLYARNLDTTSVPGWPKTYAQYYEITWTPSFGDIDGDGEGEVVATSGGPLGGWLYAYEKDGTLIFSINVGKYPMTPVLSDLNDDGAMEIILGTRTGQVYVYKGDGTVYNGWPKNIDHYIASSCAVGDINHDGTKEILAEGRNFLYVWDSNGNTMPGFPYAILDTVNGSNSYSAPVLADLFHDGNKEIMFCSHSSTTGMGGIIYAINNDGTSLSGWPKTVDNWIYAPVSIADVNGDNQYDIVVAEYGSSASPAFYLYAFNLDGSVVTNWPIGPIDGVAAQAVFADFDDDGQLEVLLDRNAQDGDFGSYVAFNFDGTPVTGFPLQVAKTSSFNQPILTDLNNDGTLDMFGGSFEYLGGYQLNNYAWNTGVPVDNASVFNPVYQYNAQHDGVFVDPTIIVPVELASFSSEIVSDKVKLSWSTATEVNNAFFELYRNNIKLAVIEGSGTTTERKYYTYVDENTVNGLYEYKLYQQDYDGSRKKVGTIEVNLNSEPVKFELSQNYPNPFNPATTISYSLPEGSFVSLKVYDVMGNEITTLVNKKQQSGKHQVHFDATNLATGLYLYQLQTDNIILTRKMMLLK